MSTEVEMKRDKSTMAALMVFGLAAAGLGIASAQTQQQVGGQGTDSSQGADPQATSKQTSGMGMTGSADDARSAVKSWPSTTRRAANAMIERNGPPDEVNDRALVWNNKDGFQRIAVYKDAGRMGHRDFIESTVAYAVPTDKVQEIQSFDSSISVDAGKGTLTARSDSEQSNLLVLNLADEIASGKRDVASAKSFKRRTLLTSEAGKKSDYTQKLLFSSSATGGTGIQPPAQPSQQQPVEPAPPQPNTPEEHPNMPQDQQQQEQMPPSSRPTTQP
jgi:hypothetical protein